MAELYRKLQAKLGILVQETAKKIGGMRSGRL